MLVKFLLTGGLATLFQYVLLEIGTSILGWSAALSSGIGYLGGSIISYLLNYFFTFKSDSPHIKASSMFYTMVAIGWLINIIIMGLMADYMEINKWVSQIITTLVVLIWNFQISRNWVFKSSDAKRS